MTVGWEGLWGSSRLDGLPNTASKGHELSVDLKVVTFFLDTKQLGLYLIGEDAGIREVLHHTALDWANEQTDAKDVHAAARRYEGKEGRFGAVCHSHSAHDVGHGVEGLVS